MHRRRCWFTQGWKDKLFAGFTNSATMNGDKVTTMAYLWTLAMQHSGIWVSMGILPTNNKAATRDSMNYVGGYGGLLTQSPSDATRPRCSRATSIPRAPSANASPKWQDRAGKNPDHHGAPR